MSKAEFYQMSFTQQADELLEHGMFLQSQLNSNFIVDLYEFKDMIVELFYAKESEELISVLAHNSSEKLDDILCGVNLTPRLHIKEHQAYQIA